MAKRRAEFNQPEFPLTLRTSCKHITAAIVNFTSKSLKDLSGNKRRKGFATGARIPMHLEQSEAVVRFCRTTSHDYDYLQAHHPRIGLALDEICPLCRIANIDGNHMGNYTELIYNL
ncbi:hypothetical protein CDAR_413621 [Caerostris darwini]|uniref:Uncharacterized protein n=1 Tax=Caerostris darwini TaxID=1538125 RepID=A0AAV4SGV5_9ARAC|nr:hypothetical protein CDAR_413621 [Caerostris darwini]